MKLPYLILSIFLTTLSQAQAPDIAWQKLIGGSSEDDLATLLITTDGGYLLGGQSGSNISGDKTENAFGAIDYWVVKLDSERNIQWQRTLGGTPAEPVDGGDYLSMVRQTADGGYLVGGTSDSGISGNKTEYNRGGDDYWIIKLDAAGNTQWQKAYGGIGADELADLRQTPDGGYILAGNSNSSASGEKTEDSLGIFDWWIIKTDSAGIIQWQKTLGGTGFEGLATISNTPDGGYIAGGVSDSPISGEKTENSYGGYDYWIVKLDGAGNIQWQKTIGGSNTDSLSDIIMSESGGYIVSGGSASGISGLKTESCRGGFDCWLMELDSAGNILWQKTIGGDLNDGLNGTVKYSDGGYLLTSGTQSGISGEKTEALKGSSDVWIIRMDGERNILWQKDIGGSGIDTSKNIFHLEDGSIIIGGDTDSSNSGDITETGHGIRDYWVLKLNPEPLSIPHHNFDGISLWPNPTTGYVNISFAALQQNITVKINNVLGQEVSTHQYENTNALTIPMSGAAGIYFLTVKNANGEKQVFKVVKD